MVPYTLPLSFLFLTRIVTSSAAVLVVTNVTLNSSGSATVGASNGTVILLNTTGPPLLEQQNSQLKLRANGSQILPNVNTSVELENVLDPNTDTSVLDLSINDSSLTNNSYLLPDTGDNALDNFPSDFIPESVSFSTAQTYR